ncbi:head morphogenesis protein [Acetobacter syzygii]|uniref:phage head morphogenesis protein n=1 Tax=Acetobacter syzygii TaxID=146476 RepID=UPI0005E3DC4E|nr:phage minor head protein [Acetobacter syzygii]GAN72119.1 phage head morphogenesis protein [Acetobacter syzygii]GBR64935.1 putative phage head morphogenesis protein [Acetobacter syzygii NRIC 0483]GEL56339.1 head morphogenesis protein [Acetobacter syzygii]
MASKPKTLKPVRPNAGVGAQYERELLDLIDEMERSLRYWLRARYRKVESRITQDASPAASLQMLMNKLTARWRLRFNDLAKYLAPAFVSRAAQHAEGSFKRDLAAKTGFTIQFKPTEGVQDAISACVEENVLLIKSIGEHHLSEVNQMVLRSVAHGGDLGELTEGLQQRFGITRRRAANIARDQNAKVTSAINKQRQIETGLFEAEWVHSAGGKHPRASHVEAGRKKLRFDVREGALIDDERIWPGQKPNCRCSSRVILRGFNDK